jgi:fatty acid CoA ligase FadD9
VCSVVHAGLAPESFYERQAGVPSPHLDGLPADFIAEAIAAIAVDRDARGYAVYHVNNVHWDDGVSLDTVVRRLERRGYPLARLADHPTWYQRFERALRELDAARQAASSLPILEQWRAPLETARRRRVDAAAFRARVQALRPHGHDDVPYLDDDYFDRCLDDLQALGLIPPPPPPQPQPASRSPRSPGPPPTGAELDQASQRPARSQLS